MNKIKNIQSLRGIAVLLVVFFHLYIVEKKYSGFDTLLPATLQFGMFGVDLFFVISGFVMVAVTRGKFQNLKQSLRFLYNRLTRIYPLYWVYTLIALIVFLIQPTWVNSSQGNQVNILQSFLLLPSDKALLVLVGWTLIHEVYFYLVYFLIFMIFPESFLVYAVIAWGAIVTVMNIALKQNNPYLNLIFNPLTIEFLSGCIIGLLYYKVDKPWLGLRTLLIVSTLSFLLAVFGFSYYQSSHGQAPPLGWWQVLIHGLPAFIITYGFINAERMGFILHSVLFQIGNASYSIYLSHLFTINVVGRIWAIFSIDHIYDNIFFVLITLATVLLVGFLSYWLVENKLLEFSRRIVNR